VCLSLVIGPQSFVFKQRTTDKEQKTWSLNPRSLGGKNHEKRFENKIDNRGANHYFAA
jgi:hypothetical protein